MGITKGVHKKSCPLTRVSVSGEWTVLPLDGMLSSQSYLTHQFIRFP